MTGACEVEKKKRRKKVGGKDAFWVKRVSEQQRNSEESNGQREARGGCESLSVWCAVLPREAELEDLDESFRRPWT